MEDADLTFIINKLRASGRVWTSQRQALYDYFKKLTIPTDAEKIWLELRANGITVSRDTIYNTLRLLISLGFADKHLNPDLNAYEYFPVKKFNT